MKARLLSPDDVDAVLELISNSHNHENRNRNAAENDNTALEINFGVPGQPPIRITSPDQLRTAIPTGGENNGHFELELDFGELIRRTLDYEACQIDATRLAELLRHSSALLNGNKMTHLTLNKLDLRQSLDAFWNVFGQDCCSQLRHVVAKQCLWDMNQWVQQGLIRVPRLQNLHLGRFMGVAPAPPRLTLPNISSLLQQKRNTIQELNLGFVKVPSPNSIVDFCVALGQCSTLRRLSCDNMVGSSYGPSALDDDDNMISAEQIHQTIGQTIAQATTSLKELTLPVLGKGSLEPIAHGLARNVGLKNLRLQPVTDHHWQVKIEGGHEHPEVMALRDAAAVNLTLQRFEFQRLGPWGRNLSTEHYDWPRDMDKKKDPNRLALAQLQFYLHLNRLGRRPFLTQSSQRTTTRADWINMVVKHRKNESVTFYFLRLNASLFFV